MSKGQGTPTGDRKLLNGKEAAAYIGVSAETLRKWAKAGTVPHLVTPMGRRFYRLKDLDRVVARWER